MSKEIVDQIAAAEKREHEDAQRQYAALLLGGDVKVEKVRPLMARLGKKAVDLERDIAQVGEFQRGQSYIELGSGWHKRDTQLMADKSKLDAEYAEVYAAFGERYDQIRERRERLKWEKDRAEEGRNTMNNLIAQRRDLFGAFSKIQEVLT